MGEQKRVLAVVLAGVREVECKALLASGQPRANAAVYDRHDASASPSRAKPKAGCWDVAVVETPGACAPDADGAWIMGSPGV